MRDVTILKKVEKTGKRFGLKANEQNKNHISFQ